MSSKKDQCCISKDDDTMTDGGKGCRAPRNTATALGDTAVTLEKLDQIIQRAKEWALLNGVQMGIKTDGVTTSKASFAPMTLFPSPVPYCLIKQAKLIQTEYNKLMHKVAYDHEFLEQSLKNVIQVDDFTNMLWDIYMTVRSEGLSQPVSLGLFRNDYMTNVKNRDCNCDTMPGNLNLKQIEFNTVAASFSGLSSGIWNVHRFTMSMAGVKYNDSQIPDNQPSAGFAKGLVKAWELYGQPQAAIVMVVQECETNFIDQRWIERKVFEQNDRIKFIYTCLNCSQNWTLDEDKRLYIDDNEIAVIYFRDGYGPTHYPSKTERDGRLMMERSTAIKCPSIQYQLAGRCSLTERDGRLMMERSTAIKCPSIQYQLAGCKKIQQTLAVPGSLERFIEDKNVLQKIKKTFAGQYSLDKGSDGDHAITLAMSCPQNFVLKPQREGGGNNVYGDDIRDFLTSIKDTDERNAYILMERIFPVIQRNVLLKEGIEPVSMDVISEIGIYGIYMGSDKEEYVNEEVGTLVRTKSSGDNEGGIVAGFATIDSAFLQD